MNNKNNNYRVMKFLEPVNKNDKYRGYVRLDIRGTKGMIIVSVENLGDNKTTSDVYLYKDKKDKIKIGTVNNKKGMIKRTISFGSNSSNIEDYNVCGVVKDNKIVLYSNLYNSVNLNDVRKLENEITSEDVNEDFDIISDLNNSDEEPEKTQTEAIEHNDDNTIDLEPPTEQKLDNEEEIDNFVDDIELVDNSKIRENDEQKNNEEINTAHENETSESNSIYENYDDGIEALSKKTVYKNKFEENLYGLLNSCSRLEPLSVNIKNLSWWKIPYDDRGVNNGFLPYYNQIISTYYPFPMSNRVTTCQGLIKKYNHYIFGIYKENNCIKRFVYGVPGEFKRDEQPYKGITGFKNWSYKNKDLDGAYGYWIAFVDSNTGEVTEPPQIVLGK